jgi:hypothetical protein
MMMNPSRRLWTLYEPIHAAVYFADEVRAAAAAAGYKGFWMMYFAVRVAPLGLVGPEVAAAACYGFHPSRAQRALPDAWSYASPAQALEMRLAGMDTALRRIWGGSLDAPTTAEAANLAWAAARAADTPGRVLAAANQALPRPNLPHLALWQAATTLREHRGDGHNAVLLAAGIGPVHAHLLKEAAGETDSPTLRISRNWPDEAWHQAASDLADRGWIDTDGQLTTEGANAHADIERQTDQAAARPWRALGAEGTERLAALLSPLTHAIITAGAFPVPNPVGAPAPD